MTAIEILLSIHILVFLSISVYFYWKIRKIEKEIPKEDTVSFKDIQERVKEVENALEKAQGIADNFKRMEKKASLLDSEYRD